MANELLNNPEKEFVLVETIYQFRQRYLVEVPKDEYEWALDTVVGEDAKEFSQKQLGETIVSHRIIDKDDIIPLCDEDNDYAKSWDDELKLKTFVTFQSDYDTY
jgi:hypothetical protein